MLEFGHISRSCPQERIAVEQVEIKCVNCNELGHRVRDCKEPRRNKFACRNCGYSSHLPPRLENSHADIDLDLWIIWRLSVRSLPRRTTWSAENATRVCVQL